MKIIECGIALLHVWADGTVPCRVDLTVLLEITVRAISQGHAF